MLIIANVNNITRKLYSKFKYEKNDLIAFNILASEPISPPKEISGNIIDMENSSKIDKTIAKNIAISNLLGKCFIKYESTFNKYLNSINFTKTLAKFYY